MAIRLLLTDEEIARCFDVLAELRPHIPNAAKLLELTRLMFAEGAEIAALETAAGEIATVAAFRVQTMLVTGKTMYVDDLVTANRLRSQGHGKAMLEWLMIYAEERGCEHFSLDSGTFRHEAHAFYFRQGLRITSFHFARKL